MKCYYEVLDVSKDADDGEIKTAYRKMALKWHPDKNLDNPEHAKEQFQVVQQAYEVLSDRQERAWYDNHREQILRGSNSDFQDNSLDVFPYFTTTCFQGFNDDEKGFYTVYREVFEQIAKEDMEFMEDKDEFCEIPQFGTSTSHYENVVKPFYDYWMSYSTKKSYSWLDPIDIREGKGNRRVMKFIEKENKKVRSKAKADRNEEIRSLVAFVRKRDRRVQAYNKQQKAKTAENRKKQGELSKQKRLERQKQHENEVQAEWAKFDNVQSELEEIEKHLAAQFGEEISNSEEDGEEEEYFNNLYCIACNKVFKNPNAFENHESSKKHKENVEKLKEAMQEELESNITDDLQEFNDCENIDEDFKDIVGISSDSESLGSEDSHSEVEKKKCKLKKKNKRKNRSVLNPNIAENLAKIESDNLESDIESTSSKMKTKKIVPNEIGIDINLDIKVSDDDFDFGMSKKQKKKNNRKNISIKNKKEENILSVITGENSHTSTDVNSGTNVKTNEKESKPLKKTTKKPKSVRKEVTAEDLKEMDINHCCVTCKTDFPSKNKLFDHLKQSGHGVYLPSQKFKQGGDRKKNVVKD